MSSPHRIPGDTSFGPQLRGQFDFTLLFEQAILVILPSSIFICASAFILCRLIGKPLRAHAGWLLPIKTAIGATLIGLEVANLVLWSRQSFPYQTTVSTVAAVFSLLAAICTASLSAGQHRYSPRLSSLLSIYLCIATLFDITRARSYLRRPASHVEAYVLMATLIVKFALLLLEEVPKRGLFLRTKTDGCASKEQVSGFWTRRVFGWLNPMLWDGFHSILHLHEMQFIGSDLDSELLLGRTGDKWEAGWFHHFTIFRSSSLEREGEQNPETDKYDFARKASKESKHSLLGASSVALASEIAAPILPRLMFAALTFTQPFLLHSIVDAVGSPHTSSQTSGGLIGATALVYLGIAICRGWYMHLTYRFLTKLRGSLVALIYQKIFRLRAGSDSASAAVTHMSTDVDSIVLGLETFHDTWASVLEIGAGAYMLSRYVGAATFLVIIPIILSTVGSVVLAARLGPAKMAWNQTVQDRVSATSGALAQLKGIKMLALDTWYINHLQNLRVVEMDKSKRYRGLVVWMYSLGTFATVMSPVIIIAGSLFWTRLGGSLTATQVFTSLSIISLISQPLASLLTAVPRFWSVAGCFIRIQEFLLKPESDALRYAENVPHPDSRNGAVSLPDSADVSYVELYDQGGKRQEKSGLFVQGADFAFEGETEPVLRDVNLHVPRSSFAVIVGGVGSGKSALLRAILGELRLCRGTVDIEPAGLSYCGQSDWLQNLSIRDNIVGCEAVDAAWYQNVVEACLLDEDIAQFDEGDEALAGSGGSNLSGGQRQRIALARAVYSRKPTMILDDVFSALDPRTSSIVFSRLLGPGGILRNLGVTVVLATHAVQFVTSADIVVTVESGGRVISNLGSSVGKAANTLPDPALSQHDEAELQASGESYSAAITSPALPPSRKRLVPATQTAATTDDETLGRQGGDWGLYRFYFQSAGTLIIVTWFILAAVYVATTQMPNVLVRIWLGNDPDNKLYFIGYAALSVLGLALGAVALGFFMLKLVPSSAENLHRVLLEAVMRQPIGTLAKVDSGTILNRFSQDMTLVSQQLPVSLFLVTFLGYTNIANIAIVASGASYVGVIIPFLVVALYYLQMFYLRTSRQMRHLDLEAKAPLYTVFSDVGAGLLHIRAFGWQTAFLKKGLSLLDASQKPYYLMFSIQRWLTFALDAFVLCITVVLVTVALELKGTSSASAIGLAMVNVVGAGENLALLIQSWTDLETSLGAIARLRTYLKETPAERDQVDSHGPPKSWPDRGRVEIRSLVATYGSDSDSQPVLKGISVTVEPGQTVGVVGRTGSGKSSLVLTLLNMLDVTSGSLLIDGVDITEISLQYLRSHITTIMQDPVLLPGTLRNNLQPLNVPELPEVDDTALLAAMERVGLLVYVQEPGALDADMSTLQLSSGETQLLCLARAIVHNRQTGSRVILVDEATSNMDEETQDKARDVFRGFSASGCTVIAIAHRLSTLIDADMTIELSNGNIVQAVEGSKQVVPRST